MRGAVGRRRHPVRAAEARGERADALQADGRADVGDRPIGVPQQRRRALEPAREQVLVRRLSERAPELATEVRRREVRRACERGHVERLAVAGVDDVARAQEVPCWWNGRVHRVADATRYSIASAGAGTGPASPACAAAGTPARRSTAPTTAAATANRAPT